MGLASPRRSPEPMGALPASMPITIAANAIVAMSVKSGKLTGDRAQSDCGQHRQRDGHHHRGDCR